MLRLFVVAVLATLLLNAAAVAADPTFTNHAGPADIVGDAGEPSIGFNPKSGAVMFQSNTQTARVDFSKSPPRWTDVSYRGALTSLDPILYTDRGTGRSLVSQLVLACSLAGFSDDDGGTWAPSQGCGVGTVLDHQTLGGGPFAPNGQGGIGVYPNAVYYCAQNGVQWASCAISRDGGMTFGPGIPAYTAAQCPQLLHGHIKVGPDGTAYLPVFDCDGGKQSLAVSTDNGSSWSLVDVPQSRTQDESDPHLGIGPKGTLYFGYQGADGTKLPDKGYIGPPYTEGHAWISVRPAGSTTWRPPVDVGAKLGIKNIQFPEVIAGDDNRAAYAFLGTTTAGDDQDPDFAGIWHLYVAFTYDGGVNWTTVDATPTDPVQRGCIWLQGGSSDCRNLLDFNDITVDGAGNVLVGYADGCIADCVTDASSKTKSDLGTIAQQTGGTGLFAIPGAPAGTATVPRGTTPTPGSTHGSSQGKLPACAAASSGFKSVSAKPRSRGVRLAVSRNAKAAASVEVFQETRGRRVLAERRVARFAKVKKAVTWRARRAPAGVYFARFTVKTASGVRDVRRIPLERRRSGRFRVLEPFTALESCGAVRSFKLLRPVFGGRHPLSASFVAGRDATFSVDLLRGERVLRRGAAKALKAGKRRRVSFGALPGRKRGVYKVRVSVRSGERVSSTTTLYARKVR